MFECLQFHNKCKTRYQAEKDIGVNVLLFCIRQ